MTNKEINKFVEDVDRLLVEKRLADVFAKLRNVATSVSAWPLNDRIAKAEQGYNYMLSYMVDGSSDPSRADIYASLLTEAAAIRDALVRQLSLTDTPTLYFGTLRSVNSHVDESFGTLYDSYRQTFEVMSPFNSVVNGATPSESDRLKIEMTERDIFNRLWVTFPMNSEDSRVTKEFIADKNLPVGVRALAVSGLTLGLLEYYDERRMELLCDIYQLSEPTLSLRALVGLVLALDKYKHSPLGSALGNTIEALRETKNWNSDVRQVFVELIRTNDTERISKKLRQEIFPNIQRMGKDMADKFAEMSAEMDTADGEYNPEWESMLADEKVRSNLKELGDLQQEGADVFMATFSNLKQFPFFNDVANWFMPFNPEHTVITSLGFGEATGALSSLIVNAPFVCDSDKYSMALSLSMMPSVQRTMVIDQLKAHSGNLDELMAGSDSSTQPRERKSEINNYVLSIYRFYKLFRRKGEFYNPFDHVVNPFDINALAADFNDEETLSLLGEFYFKVGLYEYSQKIYIFLDDISMPDAARYQRIGYCLEKLGRYDSAASYYEQADLLNGTNVWNLRRLMCVLRRLCRYSQAIAVGQRLEALIPDDIQTAITMGQLLTIDKQYDDAINRFRKVEFLDEGNTKVVRPLAWALMLSRQFEESAVYYKRLLADNPTSTDYLNAGHLAWATNNLRRAVELYSQAAKLMLLDNMAASLRNDLEHLASIGIDTSISPLIVDAVNYTLKSE